MKETGGRPRVHADTVLGARGLGRQFGALFAVRDIDLDIGPGEAVAVFGPNGAGKTTLARLLAGSLKPSTGTLRLLGKDPWRSGGDARLGIGFVGHHTLLYDDLTARENLRFFARLHGLSRPDDIAAAWLREVGLEARADDPVRTFSRGMQQRLSIARALIHDPRFAVLDEPFTGLDQEGAALLRRLLSERRLAGSSFLLVTHDLSQGLDLCDRWLLLSRGRLAARGPSRETSTRSLEQTYAELAGGRGAAHAG